MDAVKTGALIAQARKEKNLTQKDLAQSLHVSVQAVSKWERGLNFPDLALMEPLAELLGLTVSELMTGERNAAPGEELVLTVQRTTGEGEAAVTEVLDVTASTFWDEALGRSRIGITYGMGAISWDRTRLGLIDGLKHSWSMCIDAGTTVYNAGDLEGAYATAF